MKKFNLIIIVFFKSLLFWANGHSTDSILQNEYLAGRIYANQIIFDNNLSDSIAGKSFCFCLIGKQWTLSIQQKDGIVYYYGSDKNLIGRYFVDKTPNEFKNILPGNDMILEDLKLDTRYRPIYMYFIAYNDSHTKYREWSSSTKGGRTMKKYSKRIDSYIKWTYRQFPVYAPKNRIVQN